MKLTETQLRQIIREELQSLNELDTGRTKPLSPELAKDIQDTEEFVDVLISATNDINDVLKKHKLKIVGNTPLFKYSNKVKGRANDLDASGTYSGFSIKGGKFEVNRSTLISQINKERALSRRGGYR